MPTDTPRLPKDTHKTLLTRGAAYCPALAYEVREVKPRASARLARILADATIILAAITVLLLALACAYGR